MATFHRIHAKSLKDIEEARSQEIDSYIKDMTNLIRGAIRRLEKKMPKRKFVFQDCMGITSISVRSSGNRNAYILGVDENSDFPFGRFVRKNRYMQMIVNNVEEYYRNMDDPNPSYLGLIQT